MIGKTISHYKILEKLGEGGTGVVYKAEDTKLKRTVALKFLAAQAFGSKEEKTRFVREAQAAATLLHPHVATIFDLEQAEGRNFIVMEFIDGKSLKERIASSPLKLDEALDLAIQTAEGLHAAYEKGIVHRDIKSANIMMTSKGEAKITDFGLAKLTGRTQLTKSGTTLGTIAYMSPEQLQGESVDRRTDIWSLGVVIYEMLTGRLPFKGEYDQAVAYLILNQDPEPITGLRTGVPMELERLVNKALAKNPQERYQHVSDLQVDLKRLQREESSSAKEKILPPAHKQAQTRNRIVWSLVSLLIVIIAAIGIYVFNPFAKTPTQPMKTTPFTSLPGVERSPAFSPDGKQLAFAWAESDTSDTDIYVKFIGANEPLRLTTLPGEDSSPIWSPDGRHIAFNRVSEDKQEWSIYIVPALGGSERRIHSGYGERRVRWYGAELSWSPDGTLLAFTDYDSTRSIFLLSLATLEKSRLTLAPTGDQYSGDFNATFSPDGKRVAFSRRPGWDGDIYTVPVAGGEPKRLTFDVKYIEGLTWSPDGEDIIFSSDRGGSGQTLWRIGASGGSPERLAAGGQNSRHPTISPDGRRLAYSEYIRHASIWRIKIPESPNRKAVPSKLINSTRWDTDASYSPDGKRIAFGSERSGNFDIWVCDSDGQNPVQLTFLEGDSGTPGWSPDGKRIAFDAHVKGNADIFVMSADGGPVKALTTEPSQNIVPSWSRNGNWIYFSSNRSGEFQIWKIPSQGGPAAQVTTDGGFRAFESKDGRWLYYSGELGSPIWKMPVVGGEKSLVVDAKIAWPLWALVEDGIYYINRAPTGGVNIEFLNFTTKQVKKITTLDLDYSSVEYLSISPEGWLMYTYNTQQADIMMVENFR